MHDRMMKHQCLSQDHNRFHTLYWGLEKEVAGAEDREEEEEVKDVDTLKKQYLDIVDILVFTLFVHTKYVLWCVW